MCKLTKNLHIQCRGVGFAGFREKNLTRGRGKIEGGRVPRHLMKQHNTKKLQEHHQKNDYF